MPREVVNDNHVDMHKEVCFIAITKMRCLEKSVIDMLVICLEKSLVEFGS